VPDGPTEIATDILTAIREDIGSFQTSFEERLDRLEQKIRKCQRDTTATMVIMRATVGRFKKCVSAIEKRVTALETPKS
jgi:translation initiation factor 2B subunit (eIF-2B alpha/beta/delta family)